LLQVSAAEDVLPECRVAAGQFAPLQSRTIRRSLS